MSVALQMLREYDTLYSSSSVARPMCFCGKSLFDVDVSRDAQGVVRWDYIPKANIVKEQHKTWCSDSCKETEAKLVEGADASQTLRHILGLAEDEPAAEAVAEAEIAHYAAGLQLYGSKSKVFSASLVAAGTVLCGVPGVVVKTSDLGDNPYPGAKYLDLKHSLQVAKRLRIDSSSLAHRIRWETDEEKLTNASLAATNSLLSGASSLWGSSPHVLAPGGFVIVAERPIAHEEEIILRVKPLLSPEGQQIVDTCMAPRPHSELHKHAVSADADADEPGSALDADEDLPEWGLRLPGDCKPVSAEDPEPAVAHSKLKAANAKRLRMKRDAQIKASVDALLKAAPPSMKKALTAYAKSSANRLQLLDSLVVFKGKPVFLCPLENEAVDIAFAELKASYDKLMQEQPQPSSDRNQRGKFNQHQRKLAALFTDSDATRVDEDQDADEDEDGDENSSKAGPFQPVTASERGEISESDFAEATAGAQVFDPFSPAFLHDDFSYDKLQQRGSKIVNRRSLSLFHACLSTPSSRECMQAHWKEVRESGW